MIPITAVIISWKAKKLVLAARLTNRFFIALQKSAALADQAQARDNVGMAVVIAIIKKL